MIVPAETQRQYWHDVLNGAGRTTLPRWPGQAGPGVAEHVEPIPAHLTPTLRAGQLLAAQRRQDDGVRGEELPGPQRHQVRRERLDMLGDIGPGLPGPPGALGPPGQRGEACPVQHVVPVLTLRSRRDDHDFLRNAMLE